MELRRTLVVVAFLLLPACAVEFPGAEGSDATVSLDQSDELPPPSDLADVVAEVLPSVVNVRVSSLQCDALGGVIEGQGEGSGVVIDRSGIILTNAHVVQGAVDVEVVFNDDRDPLQGEVVGVVTQGSDLAIVRVEANDLDPIEIGKSANLRLGDDVVAIGFPLGLGGPTVTKGILSAVDRSISTDGSTELVGLLQTDAAINPGNSGGALIDGSGKLIGINTAAAQASQAENIGFAIAIDGALPVVEEILNNERGAWLGVSIGTIATSAEALRIGLPAETRGAFVAEVVPGGPAQEAGIGQGDVVTGLGDDAIESADDLIETLSDHEPGDQVTVVYVNTAGEHSTQATLEPRPEVPPLNC